MLLKGVFPKSHSPSSAPAILVPKKSMDGKPKFRFCVEFRALKAETKIDPYPLPHLEDSTSNPFDSKYFSYAAIRDFDKLTSLKIIRS
jgi:hypothetical protein